jgi:hypothetical protein
MRPAEARNLSSVVADLQVIREQQDRWHDPQKENYNVKPGCEECPEELSRDTRGRRPDAGLTNSTIASRFNFRPMAIRTASRAVSVTFSKTALRAWRSSLARLK